MRYCFKLNLLFMMNTTHDNMARHHGPLSYYRNHFYIRILLDTQTGKNREKLFNEFRAT